MIARHGTQPARPGKKRQAGFTLLEVLVAMAIVALGLTAVVAQMNQMASASIYLQDKTLGTWIALDRVTEIRLGDEFPEINEYNDDIEMAGRQWNYTVNVSQTLIENIRRIEVFVYLPDQPENPIASAAGLTGPPVPRSQNPRLPGVAGGDPGNEAGGRFR